MTQLELLSAQSKGVKPKPPATEAEPVIPKPSARAAEFARTLSWLPGERALRPLQSRCHALRRAFQPLLAALESRKAQTKSGSEDFHFLRENIFLVRSELDNICASFDQLHKLPQVRSLKELVTTRIAALTEDYLAGAGYEFSVASFSEYIEAFQEVTVLDLAELWSLVGVLKLVLLEQVAERGRRPLQDPTGSYGVRELVVSLREVKQTNWRDTIEPLIRFERILRDDPAGAYAKMDRDSRQLYRSKLVRIADRSDCSEMDVALAAVALAREAQRHPDSDPRVTLRRSHIGTYLLAEGTPLLEQAVGYRAPVGERIRGMLRAHPDDFYLPGIVVLTLAIVLGVVLALTDASTSLGLILLATLAVLLPSSQSAVQVANYLVTLIFPAQILPKLDFVEGLPKDCTSLVAIPTLLLNEKQVRKLADDLEVRFLGNHDPSLHFMLLTDLPDSAGKPEDDNSLVDLACELIRGLNEKYRGKEMGSFFLLHRRPIYNPRERLWMGWERKRGKLMDLNNFLCGKFDSFPVKVGDLSVLSGVRFVITLDSDTELPRGSARRMVGALAHPLNQAIIDPDRGVVVSGYGILQPRVGVSVLSSARSRLASIYSGQTGLDIYTTAASDVYQDLYGEGIFVGKGIYEVETLHRVLDRRFPRNALLSHDLVEGAYARAGLVSDIEVIEDYPSHYSAHNRRKHRWLRGDWQIAEWVRPLVPEESGEKVPNPLSVVARWKIFDNLRRSLVEPAFFVLLLLGWLCLPGGPGAWTLATVGILFLPALCQLGYELANAAIQWKESVVVDAFNNFADASVANLLTLTFLAHQALLSIDAVVRTMVRRLITRQRLLQWETAAQAELAGVKRTVLDIYLSSTPALALGLLIILWVADSRAVPAALPVLLLWALSKPISAWLNRPPGTPHTEISTRNHWLLRQAALRTWRYFAEFSNEEHHWLIPDNLQEEGTRIAARISPTNLGFLLNARQVACTMGYLTVPEFAQQTLRTLATVSRLESYRGHLLNWYDTKTLAPLEPAFVSSVDSGNLVASLWTLQRGCLELLDKPLLQRQLQDGFLDHAYLLTDLGAMSRGKFAAMKKELKQHNWLQYLLDIPDAALKDIHRPASRGKHAAEAEWFRRQAEERIRQICRVAQLYAPWMLPEFAALKDDAAIYAQGRASEKLELERIPQFIDDLGLRLKVAGDSSADAERNALYAELLALLPDARTHVVRLIADIKAVANGASQLAEEMDFAFLVSRSRGMLSIGYDVRKNQLHAACYDLLASEARTAFFVAIAKDDIPQESWFQLGRSTMMDRGMTGLLSWTGTMFEYLMPALWMRIYPNTLLERAAITAVRSQRAYADDKGIFWGISESSCFKNDDCGNYQYHAFGVPPLAVHKVDVDGPVVSPYSTMLALPIDSNAALRNLQRMRRRGALGSYGFYESLDFNPARVRSRLRRSELVRVWMAHHQGMSLLAMLNFLHDDVVQRWFHSHPRVQATELLLQEKPAALRPQGSRKAA
jgi:cyclic beta-1,2-glucan synthetase